MIDGGKGTMDVWKMWKAIQQEARNQESKAQGWA